MSPRLFELSDNGRLVITPNALLIEETKNIIDKYGMEEAVPPLAYCHLLSAIDSPLRNLPEEERKETALIEIYSTLNVKVDQDDPLIEKCIEKLRDIYATPTYKLFELAEEEIHSIMYYLRTTPISSEDLGQRKSILQDMGKISASVAATKRIAMDEMKQNTRGDQETGEIY